MQNIETLTEFGTDIVYLSDLNNKIKSGEIHDIIMYSDAIHERMIVDVSNEIADKGSRIVLIAGPSASGKTSFTKRLCLQLWVNGRKPIYIGTDDYFIARDKVKTDVAGFKNFENLEAIDINLFSKQMKALLDGEEVDLPRFDFITGNPVFGERLTKAYDGQVIVVEGIHALNPALTTDIDPKDTYKIFVEPMTEMKIDPYKKIQTSDVRKLRRIVRDNAHRGWSPEDTLKVWETVRNGELENIIPFKSTANCMFDSFLLYELAALKPAAAPLLEKIEIGSTYYIEAQRLLDILDHVEPFSDKEIKVIANNSILREFIGGSIVVE